MRFLLFPTKVKKSLSRATNVNGRMSQHSQHSIPKSTVLTTPTNSAVEYSQQEDESTKVTWGQQCSQNCGCVVRFTANIDTTTDSVVAIDYTCKSLIIGKNPATNERVVAKTSKGRPLFQECKCTTLKSLSNIVVQEIRLRPNWKQLYADTFNFETTRSSNAFRQAVLHTQNLPSKDASCFDVVEEAVTAMIKGYMPVPRQSNIVVTTQNRKLKTLQKYYVQEEDEDEEANDTAYDMDSDYYQNMKNLQNQSFYGTTSVLPFGNIVEQMSSSKPSILAFSSTLSMYDKNLERQQQREDEEKQRRNQQAPTSSNNNRTFSQNNTEISDWESYVDYQYQEDQKSSA
jgi:hypothetical protein